MERYYGNVDFARRPATIEDFYNHITKIKLVWREFKKIYVKQVSKKYGMVSFDDINRYIDKAKSKYSINRDENIAVEGFFDGVCGIMNIYHLDSTKLFKLVDNEIEMIEQSLLF